MAKKASQRQAVESYSSLSEAGQERQANFKRAVLDKLERTGGELLSDAFDQLSDDQWFEISRRCKGRARAILTTALMAYLKQLQGRAK